MLTTLQPTVVDYSCVVLVRVVLAATEVKDRAWRQERSVGGKDLRRSAVTPVAHSSFLLPLAGSVGTPSALQPASTRLLFAAGRLWGAIRSVPGSTLAA